MSCENTVEILELDVNIDDLKEIEQTINIPLADGDIDDLGNIFEEVSVEQDPITIYVAKLFDKLKEETVIRKYYDSRAGMNRLNITPPTWFYTIEQKYQDILIRIVEPFLEERLKQP